ncbi:hexosaminidase D-like [Planococcus citri]|uniref:hexosaminidase D-like n=1 Tax=Planococcus citri TaxID=170843 RepID=UPI0031F8F650
MDSLNVEGERLIHLDLKVCPLKVDYLEKLFKVFREWGGTGLLIEWEDTFPYEGELEDIGSLHTQLAYSVADIQSIQSLAEQNNLIVIPLVQTFGHLEFVLKTPKWKHLREVPRYASSMCPSHPESLPLVTSMVKQIINLHPNSQFIHIGGDEVWHMSLCENCRQHHKHDLFMKHITSVLRFVKENYPNVTPIMWDDMLRSIDINLLKEFEIGQYVEPMVWEYHRVDTFSLGTDLWEKYSDVFEKIWVASAFKGATGSCQILPIVGHHLSNHEKWLDVVAKIRSKFKSVRGIALTGWSRYDHYATLCELIPTGLTSLALCLKTWVNGKYDGAVYKEISTLLGYSDEAPLILYPLNRPLPIAKFLNFPGYQIYIGVEWFANIRARYNYIAFSDQAVTWLNTWHVKRNNTSVMQVEHIIVSFRSLLDELSAVERHLSMNMPEAFYDNTIEEWLGCYLYPLKEKLIELIKDAESQLKLE